MDIQHELHFVENLWDAILEIEQMVRDRHDWLSDLRDEAWENEKNNEKVCPFQEPF